MSGRYRVTGKDIPELLVEECDASAGEPADGESSDFPLGLWCYRRDGHDGDHWDEDEGVTWVLEAQP